MIFCRKTAGLSQKALAEKSGVSLSTIGRLENGHSVGAVGTLWQLSRALGVSIDTYVSSVHEDGVEVFVPPAGDREDNNLFVAVNGKNYLIPKGRVVTMPVEVATEYLRSLRAAAKFSDTKDELLF